MSTSRLLVACCLTALACAGGLAQNGCGSKNSPGFGSEPPPAPSATGPAESSDAGPPGTGSSSGGGGSTGGGVGSLLGDGGGLAPGEAGANAPPGALPGVVRDFRFYDASDPMTDPDFENPPMNAPGGWDDRAITDDAVRRRHPRLRRRPDPGHPHDLRKRPDGGRADPVQQLVPRRAGRQRPRRLPAPAS